MGLWGSELRVLDLRPFRSPRLSLDRSNRVSDLRQLLFLAGCTKLQDVSFQASKSLL